jgi:hypothetical protein
VTHSGLRADTTAGKAPTGTLTAAPDQDTIGAGMTMTFTASKLADEDCKDKKNVDGGTPTESKVTGSGLTILVDDTNANKSKVIFPVTAGSVTVKLEVNDLDTESGGVHDDGSFVEVASKAIAVVMPDKTDETAENPTTNPITGVQYDHLVTYKAGTVDAPYGVKNLVVTQARAGLVNYWKDGAWDFAKEFGDATKYIDITTNKLTDSGTFYDPIGFNIEVLKEGAKHAKKKYVAKMAILGHKYGVKVDGTNNVTLTGSFDHKVEVELSRAVDTDPWEVTYYGVVRE